MAEIQTSLADRIVAYAPGAAINFVTFLGRHPALSRDDGTVTLGAPDKRKAISAHPEGAILTSATTGKAIVTGGDDGLVVRIGADGGREIVHDAGGRWIDSLTAREDGAIAWATGKTVSARDTKGTVRQITVPTTARGLAFAPKGYRLAIAHYNGASFWFPNTDQPPEAFEWKGSHIDVTVSPDGRFIVTSMQEAALHGWRVSDHANMRMSGYPSRVKSMAWSADGAWLATSGADSCVVWPFRDKDGPMNKAPRECAVRKAKISKVAFNPKALMLAIGYEDGWILLCRLTDASETLVRRPDALRDPVTALAWSGDGNNLLFGTAGGEGGLVTLPSG